MNNKVNFLRGTSTEYATSTKDNDTFYYTTDDEKLYLGGTEITGIEIDDTSTTATDKTWSAKKISDSIPTELPANGGNADTLDGKHYFDFVNYLGEITDVDNILNNPEYGDCSYEGIISSNVATSIGLSSAVATEWSIKCFRSSEGSGFQIAVPIYNSSETPKYRIAVKHHLNGSAYSIGWDNWQNFSDNGNADTVDGLGTDVIPHGYQTLYDNADQCTKSGYYMLNSTALNIPVATFGLLIVNNGDYANADATWAVQTFYLTSNGDAYRRMYVNGKFTTWVNIADGGNADTLDSKHSSDSSQIISFGNTSTDTKTAIGINGKTTTYWCAAWTDYPATLQDGQGMIIAVNYKNYGTSVGVDYIWCRQIFISPHPNTKIYQRILSGTDIGKWTNIADGGNAASVGGKTITVTDVDPGAGSALGTGEIVFVTEVT